jgi:hypothetical protein
MASTGSRISKQSIVDDYFAYIRNPAYNAVVFWSGSNPGPTRIRTALLGPRDFSANLSTGNIGDTRITASTIINQVRAYAYYTTVARRARSGYITDNFSPNTAETTTGDRTDVCRLTDAYLIAYSYGGSLGNPISAPNINSFYSTIRSTASQAQSSAAVVDLRVCHSSCHSACHGSRGRR